MVYLKRISFNPAGKDEKLYPFSLPFVQAETTVDIDASVTFLVGENGSGKSTLLEGIADHCGFSITGGSGNHRLQDTREETTLFSAMRLSWTNRMTQGFFMRAESFYNFASFVDTLAEEGGGDILGAYGGKSLHEQSHGESFLSLFTHRFSKGIYLLDEPEAALSPERQYAFMMTIQTLVKKQGAQFVIATHSPILMAFPGATILYIDGAEIRKTPFKETIHYQFTRNFLNNPEEFTRHILAE